jgi:hypothetical protein
MLKVKASQCSRALKGKCTEGEGYTLHTRSGSLPKRNEIGLGLHTSGQESVRRFSNSTELPQTESSHCGKVVALHSHAPRGIWLHGYMLPCKAQLTIFAPPCFSVHSLPHFNHPEAKPGFGRWGASAPQPLNKSALRAPLSRPSPTKPSSYQVAALARLFFSSA